MGERGVRNAEVRGSIPLISTYRNVSEFLQLNENIGYYLRSEFLPQSWNNGIVAFLKDIIHF
jgi:hypothetical protein